MPGHRVVTVVQDGGLLLDLAIPVHVFGYHGGGRYRHTLAGAGGRAVRTCTGVRVAVEGGVRLVAICTGAFTLAWAGLLDGRRVTTHWSVCHVLAQMFPAVRVDPGVLYIDDGDVLTSAGVAAGLDLCLHIVRT